ncbi:MAG: beta-galactosidase [Abditibacteriota bacterium]|nr:beta-galactosidase [Abditibacteriota bacterium]
MRKLLVILALLTPTALFAKDPFFISFWEAPHELSEASVRDAAEAGFTVYFDYLHNSAKEQKELMELCRKYGLKVLVHDERIYTADKEGPVDRIMVENVVEEYRDDPIVWGYSIADEPFPEKFHDKAAIAAGVRAADPERKTFINMHRWGACYVLPKLFDKGDHTRYIDEMLLAGQLNFLSYDEYSFDAEGKNGMLDAYFRNLEIIRAESLKHNIPFNSIILDTQHWQFRDPTDAEIRWQVYTALAYGSKGITYFTYAVPTGDASFVWGDGLMDRDGNKTRRYYAAKKINHEIGRMSDVLMNLKSVGVFHTSKIWCPLVNPVPAENFIQIDGGDFLLGQFTSPDGYKYAMVTNSSFTDKQTARLTFAQSTEVEEVGAHGGRGLRTSSTTWRKTLNPGDGVLLRLKTGVPMYAKWDYNGNVLPKVAVYAPTPESFAAAEEARKVLWGKVTVTVMPAGTREPAHVARRFRSDAYIVMGEKSYYMPFSDDASMCLATSIDSEAEENAEAFEERQQIFCPAAVVKVDDGRALAKGILDYLTNKPNFRYRNDCGCL